jgi:hypothetical protein
MVQVCESIRTKHDMLETSLEQYREVFVRARNNFATVVQVRLRMNLLLDRWIDTLR